MKIPVLLNESTNLYTKTTVNLKESVLHRNELKMI